MNEKHGYITIKISWWVQPLLSLLMIPVRLKLLPDEGEWFNPVRDFIFRHGLKRKYWPRPDPRPVDVDEIEPDTP